MEEEVGVRWWELERERRWPIILEVAWGGGSRESVTVSDRQGRRG